MQNNIQNTNQPKFNIDLSQDKYTSRYARIMNILLYAKEIPTDLYQHMNMSHDNFRKAISIMKQKGLLKRISRDGAIGYILAAKGRDMVRRSEYMRYWDCVCEDNRQYDIKRRNRKRQYAYLYALFDRVGIPYEAFDKPPITDVTYLDDKVYFYTALDLKRMLGYKSTVFKGSRLMGFLIGKGQIITIYRTNYEMKVFGKHETIVPLLLQQWFAAPVHSAVMICDDEKAVINITKQIINNRENDYMKGVNTAQYKSFFVFPSDDSFFSRFEDLYTDYSETLDILIDYNEIETSDRDSKGRYRYTVGDGFLQDRPVWICLGNVNVVTFKYYINDAERYDMRSFLVCRERDLSAMKEITETMNLKLNLIKYRV